MRFRSLFPLALTAAVALSACSTTEIAGPTGNQQGPNVPNVSGNWRGTFANATVLMSWQQAGADVAGTVQIGHDMYLVTGTIDEFGTLQFSGAIDEPNPCSSIATAINDVAVTGGATEMDGVLQQRTAANMGTGCGSRVFVQQGTLEADRV
jgi:hypothetical protein